MINFNTLREANTLRLPQFKNSQGGLAHTKPDGSDWSPAMWFAALVGELGEWAEVRLAWENGDLTESEYRRKSAKELADVQTYLDLLARRSFDRLTLNPDYDEVGYQTQGYLFEDSPSQTLMHLMSHLGQYANTRKKLDRGDITHETFNTAKGSLLANVGRELRELGKPDLCGHPHPGDVVEVADPAGVNLGEVTMCKFNEVSERVGSNVRINSCGAVNGVIGCEDGTVKVGQ